MVDLYTQHGDDAQSYGTTAQDIVRLVEDSDRKGILALAESMEPIDFAAKAGELSAECMHTLLDLLPSPTIALLAKNADEPLRLRIANALDDQLLLIVLAHMQSDDVADVLGALAPARASSLLAHMREADRAVLTSLLQYPDETAGSIMTTSYIALREDRTVADCLAIIQAKAAKIEQIQTLYVLDMRGRLAGYLDLRKILSSPRDAVAARIMETRVIFVDPYADQEEAAELVARYNLNALPVVSAGQLLGVITVDDIIDVIIDEYDEDMLRLVGANEEETLDSSLVDTVRMRLPWLLVNLVTAFLASFVVKLFEGTIEQVVALSAIMTIISGMGGNAGSQTMAIVVRHLSHDGVSAREIRRSLGKEVTAGIINGAANGLVTGIVVALVYQNAFLPVIVLVAMIGNMVIAGTFGFLVPVALKACHQDPAVASSIFVTTATDVLGFFIFLGMSELFLPMLR
jgi:magnesium transporter